MNNTIKFTNPPVVLFLSQLLKDKNFDITQPTVDTYFYEVGYEIGFTPVETSYVLNSLLDMGLIKIS